MEVKYNRIIAIVFVLLGLVNLVLGVWLALLGEFSASLILGVLIAFIGVQYFRSPYFIVESNQIVVPSLIGPIKRTYPFTALKVENGRLMRREGEQWQPVPVQKWFADGNSWQQLEQRYGGVPQS